MVSFDGDTLMRSLRDVAAEVGELLSGLDDHRRRPATSQERRRSAERAERATASLDAVCRDLGAWMSGQRSGQQQPDRVEMSESAAVDAAGSGSVEVPAEGWVGVSRAQEALDTARADLQRSVESARSDGATWRQIGEALGITAQTAHKRFDPGARRRHAEYMREQSRRRRASRDDVLPST